VSGERKTPAILAPAAHALRAKATLVAAPGLIADITQLVAEAQHKQGAT